MHSSQDDLTEYVAKNLKQEARSILCITLQAGQKIGNPVCNFDRLTPESGIDP